MKTIFLPIFQGVEARNLLRNDFFTILAGQPDVRLVILVSTVEKEIYLKKEFASDNVKFVVVDPIKLGRWPSAFLDFLRFNLLRTRRLAARKRVALGESGNWLAFGFKHLVTFLLAWPGARRVIRALIKRWNWGRPFATLFDVYQPDLLVASHLFGNQETFLLLEAKRRGVRSIGVINSWDKLTSRGALLALPDKLIVHNEVIKQEAITYADLPARSIEVVGVPHYDLLFRGRPRPRVELERRFGLPAGKQIVLVCPAGQYYSDSDAELINHLIRARREGRIPQVSILVRFPPNDQVNLALVEDQTEIFWHQPGVRFSSKRGVDWDMNDEDNQLLLDTLWWSSVVVCPPSSLAIDAAVLDRPIINFVNPDDRRWVTNNINLYYISDHYSKMLAMGGVRVAPTVDELIFWINRYLADPALDREARHRIVEQQCQFVDGFSGRRLAEAVLHFLP